MIDCLFCKIAKKEIPSDIAYEDENVIAFLDIKPMNPGHTLVIPKKHVENIFDIDEKDLGLVMNVVKKIAKTVDKMSNGVNVIQNNRSAAGQVVDHLHFHIVPRYENDGLLPWEGKDISKEKSEEILKEIKGALEENS